MQNQQLAIRIGEDPSETREPPGGECREDPGAFSGVWPCSRSQPRISHTQGSGLLISWNWVEPGGGARLQPSPEGTPDFSPPAAGLTSLAGGRAEARRRLNEVCPTFETLASEWRPEVAHLISPGQPKLRGDIRSPESRRRRHECLRHVMAQVNFPNYPKSPADIRSSDPRGYRQPLMTQ